MAIGGFEVGNQPRLVPVPQMTEVEGLWEGVHIFFHDVFPKA